MRRWLALLVGVAALAVAGTALGLTGANNTTVEETATEATLKEEVVDLPVVEKPVEPAPIAAEKGDRAEDPVEEKEPVFVEKPEDSLPVVKPVDRTPPEVAILHPEDGQVFESEEVVFEGVTEPGARVFAGKYEADVREDGSWRIVLILDVGENAVTVQAKDAAGNKASDSVTVVHRAPEKAEQPKQEKPEKDHHEEKPKEEPKKDEHPEKDHPEEEPPEEKAEEEAADWDFSAHQLFGECSESPPYDVFHGSGKPGTLIRVVSEYGSGSTEVGEKGEWELEVIFETAPPGKAFPVKVKDEFGNHQVFEFMRTG